MSYPSIKRIQRIAVVGAGPGGIAAAKYVVFLSVAYTSRHFHMACFCGFYDQSLIGTFRGLLTESNATSIDIFEQQASFGGVWNYSNDPGEKIDIPQVNPDQPLEEPIWHSKCIENGHTNGEPYPTFSSPMYERLQTNIPHCLMKYSDAPSLETHQLFPNREAVTRYLEEYAEDVRHLVNFQTQVIHIGPKTQNAQSGWVVRSISLISHEVSELDYDAVVVANGHYTVPTLPGIKGITEWDQANKGIVSHSKSYRRSEPFTNKKVVIVGNSASGVDIASQIATVCKHPILNSTRSESPLTYEASYKEPVPEIVEFLPPTYGARALLFANGRIEKDIDAVLFCTGYFYSFPFLSSISPKLISTGDRVQNLYKHLFYIPDPTLAFVGLPSKIIPFRTLEGQAAVIARVWSGRLRLPSKLEMCQWEENIIAERGIGKSFHVLPFPRDFEYHNEMVAWASSAQGGLSRVPPKWTEKETWLRERFPAIKEAFVDKGDERHTIRTVEELGFDYDAWLREQGSERRAV